MTIGTEIIEPAIFSCQTIYNDHYEVLYKALSGR